ncbi:MAG: hypothetical protein HFH65_07350 [Lachnospiraceae bacterium]|nr:hypothetical protein [Lachnospiraceae bacterium]
MKTGKITAKLRDAVPVCLMVNGEEVKRYKNIDPPDMLKELEMLDFHFNVPEDGKITLILFSGKLFRFRLFEKVFKFKAHNTSFQTINIEVLLYAYYGKLS